MDSTTFDLTGYLHAKQGFFPNQYVAAIAVLVISLVIGAMADYFYRRSRERNGKRPMNILLIPLLAMLIGGISFFTWDNSPNAGGLYTSNYYDSAVNTDIATWANREYRINITPEQAGALKYSETVGVWGIRKVSYPRVRIPGIPGSVKLIPRTNAGIITLYYVGNSGKQQRVPIYPANN